MDYIIRTADAIGGILIFLPGVNEIRQCIDAIRQTIKDKTSTVLPLHANLSSDEQRRVFQQTKSWKIIAATNVAEVRLVPFQFLIPHSVLICLADLHYHRRRYLRHRCWKGQRNTI